MSGPSIAERIRQRKRLEEGTATTATPAAAQVQQQQQQPSQRSAPRVFVDPALKHLQRGGQRKGRSLFGAMPPAGIPAAATAAAAAQPPDNAILDLVNPMAAAAARREAEARHAREQSRPPFLGDPALVRAAPLFDGGVPDVEPWDQRLLALPRYSAVATVASGAITDLIHHPVPTAGAAARAVDSGATFLRRVKTKGEERKERRAAREARAKEHQERVKRGEVVEKPQLHWRNLNDVLRDEAAIAPTRIHAEVQRQYDERAAMHERANYERHCEAQQRQREKEEADKWRMLMFAPRILVMRLFPVRNDYHVEKLKIFANDRRARGSVYFVGGCDAVAVFVAGARTIGEIERFASTRLLKADDPDAAEIRVEKIFDGHTEAVERVNFNAHVVHGGGEKPVDEHTHVHEWIYVRRVDSLREVMQHLASIEGCTPALIFAVDRAARALENG